MDMNERDLRDLVFGDELASTPEREVQAISNHPERREELNRLLALRETLLSVGEEEPPRRTVLVAPTASAKAPWWKSVLGFGTPGWGFAGAMALAVAILAHGLLARPEAPQPLVAGNPAPVVEASASLAEGAIDARVQVELERRMPALVEQVRAEVRKQGEAETARLVAAAEERLRQQHDNELFEMREAVYFMKKQFGRQMVASAALASEVQ